VGKNIVICCDGTGNEFGDTNSNVVKLYSTLLIDGVQQVGYYHPGVGTMGAPAARGRIEKTWSIVMGMAFGAGLLDNVADAYHYLMECYEQGDQVYVFGFSRGAYTARVLAGMLHMFGLLHPGNEAQIPYILQLFAKRAKAAAGMKDTLHVAEGFKATFSRSCPLHFVGVWDTVSSVGWILDPLQLPFTGRNPDMSIGRHALSMEERRCYFQDKLWGEPFPGQDIKQVWFAGVHSDVGGGYPEAESGLAKDTLEWMLREAIAAGILADPAKVDFILGRIPPPPPVPADPLAEKHESLQGSWWLLELLPHSYYDAAAKKKKWRIPMGASRTIPEGSTLHRSVIERLNGRADFRPGNMPRNYSIED
jgi:uncharacterized protein (DUF2235 family)